MKIDDLNDDEINELIYVSEFKNKFPDLKIGLVVAMTSLRESLVNVFKKIPGLKSTMVINPSDTFKLNQKFDLLIVDEAHRLRQYKNISWRGAFKKNNDKLNLDNNGTELDWILANSKNQIFFYDSAQSVKPSDINKSMFDKLLAENNTKKLELKSQMRVSSGINYIQFIHDLLNVSITSGIKFNCNKYELLLFNSIEDFFKILNIKEKKFGLCRIVAGYSWEWKSDPKKKNPNLNAIDIEIGGLKFQWNQTDRDWINNPKDPSNPLIEIGCIHTVQGYDLNYTGVIFGEEIDFNPSTNKIEINSTKYFDKYGKIGTNHDELIQYIINIYKTLLYRGIRGTYVYACNKQMQEYLGKYINLFKG